MSTATLEDTLDLGINLEELRRGQGDQAAHFERIVDLLWQHHPSEMPDKVRLNLRSMGLEEAFDRHLVAHDERLPETVAWGGPVKWVITPEGL